jgi:pimeloyl-ACP methyl ester carboxylesterase
MREFFSNGLRGFVVGNGMPVLLLHGYLESAEVMLPIARSLPAGYQIWIPDIPGHGKSDNLHGEPSLEAWASAFHDFMTEQKIRNYVVAGHSMGAYLALAMAELFPKNIIAIAILHSNPFPDSDQKKDIRRREIGLVREGHLGSIVSVAIPKLYSPHNLDDFLREIEISQAVAMKTPVEGIAYALTAMAARPDRSAILKRPGLPALIIAGRHDQLMDISNLYDFHSSEKTCELHILEKSGHMGFIEEPEVFATIFRRWLDQIR